LKDTNFDERSYYYLALAYYKKKDSSKAIEYLHKAIEDDETARSFELLGNAYFVKRQLYEAEEYYKKAIQKDETLALSHARLGLLAVKNNNLATAINYYKDALKNEPDNVEFKRQLFLVHIRSKDCKAANKMIQALSSHNDYDKLKNKLNNCKE